MSFFTISAIPLPGTETSVADILVRKTRIPRTTLLRERRILFQVVPSFSIVLTTLLKTMTVFSSIETPVRGMRLSIPLTIIAYREGFIPFHTLTAPRILGADPKVTSTEEIMPFSSIQKELLFLFLPVSFFNISFTIAVPNILNTFYSLGC